MNVGQEWRQFRQIALNSLLAFLCCIPVLLTGAASSAADTQPIQFDIKAGDLASALNQFAQQSGEQIIFTSEATRGKRVEAIHGAYPPQQVLDILLSGSRLAQKSTQNGIIVLTSTDNQKSDGQKGDGQKKSGDVSDPPESSSSLPAGGAEAANSGADQDIGEITVTAQRRSELERDVPITITTLSADELRQNDAKDLYDIAQLTPGLNFNYPNGAFVQPTIRGIGTSFQTPGSGTNVGTYIDGFYNPNPIATNFQLLDVQNIQVLKGPQGTLFGRNTTGGAILVTTAQPSFTPTAVVEASYGSYNAQTYQAYASTGLTDKIAIDVDGLYRQGDGFIHNIVTGAKDGAYEIWAVHTGIKFNASDNISFLFRYSHDDINDPTPVAGNIYAANGIVYGIGPAAPGAIIATSPDEVSNNGRTSVHTQSDAYQLTTTFNFDFATLTSYSQYRKDNSYEWEDFDHSSAPVFELGLAVPDQTITQEFLLSSAPGGKLQWTLGSFLFDYKDPYPDTGGSFGGGPFTIFAHSTDDTRSAAAYADATYEITEKLFLTAGMRYSHDEVRDASFGVDPVVNVPSIDSNHVTPRVVVRYKPTDISDVYASFTRGYKPAILNVGGGSLNDINVAPEHISAYEVGYKYGTSRFSFDTSAFFYDYSDLQVASYTGMASLITNAATSHIHGLEGSLKYEVAEGLNLTVGASYVDARYVKFTTSPRFDQCLNPSCGVVGEYTISNYDASGNAMQNSPDFTGNIGLRYVAEVARGKLGLSGNLYYTSKFFFDPSNQFVQDGYALLGLRAEWTDPSERYTVAVFGDNVTNSRYRTQVLPQPYGIGSVWGAPATVGVSIRAKF